MNVLLTGATGYLGSNLTKALLRSGHKVIVLKRSFSSTDRLAEFIDDIAFYDLDNISLENIFRSCSKIDFVLHAATCYGRFGGDESEIIEANLKLPSSLLECSKAFGVHCFINFDTFFSRPSNDVGYLMPYIQTKRRFRLVAENDQELIRSGGLVFLNASLHQVYGPRDSLSKFANWVVNQCVKNVPVIPLTEGRQTRDFIYIDDVVSAVEVLMGNVFLFDRGFNWVDVGTGDYVSVRDFVELVHKECNSTSQLDFGALSYRDNEIMEDFTDAQLLKGLGWSPRFDLLMGVRELMKE